MSTTKRTLMIIDDSILVLGGLVRSLRHEFTITAVEGAVEAIKLIASGCRFDVILCDLNLDDGIGGSGFCSYLMESAPDQAARVVLMSGGPHPTTTHRCLDKPATKKDIVTMLEGVMHERDAA